MSTEQAIKLLNQSADLLSQAIRLLDEEPSQTFATSADTSDEDEEFVLEGVIGRPEIKTVGKDQVSLFTAGLKVGDDWHSIKAWRKVADWAIQNLPSGSSVTVRGEWINQTWTDKSGQPQSRTVFSVRAFDLD